MAKKDIEEVEYIYKNYQILLKDNKINTNLSKVFFLCKFCFFSMFFCHSMFKTFLINF